MESSTTDIRTEYIVWRDMAAYHSDCVGTYWITTRDKQQKELESMAKIAELQRTVANKLKKLHASLAKAATEEANRPLPPIMEPFYGNGENIPQPAINEERPSEEATQTQQE